MKISRHKRQSAGEGVQAGSGMGSRGIGVNIVDSDVIQFAPVPLHDENGGVHVVGSGPGKTDPLTGIGRSVLFGPFTTAPKPITQPDPRPTASNGLDEFQLRVVMAAVECGLDTKAVAQTLGAEREAVTKALQSLNVQASIRSMQQIAPLTRGLVNQVLRDVMTDQEQKAADRIAACNAALKSLGVPDITVDAAPRINVLIQKADDGELFEMIRQIAPHAPIADATVERVEARRAWFNASQPLAVAPVERASEYGQTHESSLGVEQRVTQAPDA